MTRDDGLVLLFDVMGTLVYDPFRVEMPAFFDMTFEELLEAKHPTAWMRFESGEIDERTMLDEFFRDGREVPSGLREHMARHYRWLDGMRGLVAELAAAGQEQHVLSNYPEWYRSIEEALGVSRWVPWTFVSCHLGLRKPDPEIFRHAARELGVPAERCLLVDDREENCAGARRTGMAAHRFREAETLRRELAERGVLDARE